MFRAIGDGRIKAVWIIGTNPVDSMPHADRVAAALAACPFVVVSDVVARTDTTKFAHVLLPAQAWGEKDGTITNSERRISRQRALRAPSGEAMPDWWALAAVARRMGFARAFDFSGPAAVFREHAALSGYRNDGARGFDISALADIADAGYRALTRTIAPCNLSNGRGAPAIRQALRRSGCSATAAFSRRTEWRASCRRRSADLRAASRGVANSCSTPAASAINGTR